MLGPLKRSIPDPDLLPEVRLLMAWYPGLVHDPERLAVLVGADGYAVRCALEALEIEGEVLA